MAKQAKKGKKRVKKSMKQAGGRNAPAAPLRGAAGSASKAGRNANASGIRPLGERVVIRPLSEDELGTRSPSGIIIPDTVKGEKPEQGTVVAVGAGKYEDGARVPLQVAVGDRVLFSKYGYDEVKVAGEEYFIVSESNILAIISK